MKAIADPLTATSGAEKVSAEEALRTSEAHYRLVLEAVSDGIMVLDASGIIRMVNPALCTMLGYAPAELTGKHLSETYVPEERVQAGERVARAAHGEVLRFTRRALRKDGSVIMVEGSASSGSDGSLYGILRDVTQREGLEATLRESERMLSLIYHNTSDVLYMVEVEPGDAFRFITVNETFLKVTGYTRDQVVDQPMERVVPRGNHELVRGKYRQAIATRAPVEYHETAELPAGRRHARITIVPIFKDDGPVTHLLASITDLTERQEAEEALKAADRRKNEFIATLAHELRNPLAPLCAGLELLDQNGSRDPELVRVRQMMKGQMTQLVQLVDDLMDLSRISRDAINLRLEDLSITDLVRVAVEGTRPLMAQRDQRLTLHLPPQDSWVKGDRTRLVQVISNLLGNAAKYTDTHGAIDLSVTNTGNDVIVEVKDNGIGIPVDMLPKVFDLFSQVDRHLDRSQGGLGIGLSIVKKLVAMHGGTVEARSDGEGEGSTFIIRLPRVNEPASSPTAFANEGTTLRSRRILVVDDNHDAALTISLLLQRMGQEAFVAYDGAQALEEAQRVSPELVLMDIGMPGMSGYDACKAMRARYGPELRIVAISGWGQEEDQRRSAEAGFDQHLVKPVDRATLRSLL